MFDTPLIGSTLTFISIDTPMEIFLTRKAQFRIGEITDKSILSAIKNNDKTNGFEKLLTYGKNSSAIYDGVLQGNPNFVASLHDDLLGNVKSNAYYFIYVKYDDENKQDNKTINNSTKPSNKEKDTTVAKGVLPQTGIGNIILVTVIILSILSILLYYLNKKYNFIK